VWCGHSSATMVPEYFREADDEPWSPIGDVPEELIE
jgi:hypothetical protein